MKELLEERQDLVNFYFTKNSFEEKDFRQMFHMFNTGSCMAPDSVCLAKFSDEQIKFITEFANTKNMFRQNVTTEDIKNLFECKLETPLQANVNRHVALFLGALRQYGLLPFSWQMIVEDNKLLSSSANNRPLTASQLRCSLSQARNPKLSKAKFSRTKMEDTGFEATCNAFVKNMIENTKMQEK